MAEVDTIAYFYPVPAERWSYKVTKKAIKSAENQSRYVPARQDRSSQDRLEFADVGRCGRALTEEPKEEKYDGLESEPCLHATFSNGPKTRHGLIAGCDPKADIRLPGIAGISFHHFSLTFNGQYLPIVRDLGSSFGTSITYGKDETEPRSSFDWIVGGHDFLTLKSKSPIHIRVTEKLQFHLIIPERDIYSPSYRAKVDNFLEGATDTDELLNGIKLVSRGQTTVGTGTHTPRRGPIILKEKIGEGAFAVVYRAFNVSTGEEWASKELSKEGKKKIWKSQWEKEVGIMQRVSHDHIVKFLGVDSNLTALRLEYISGGSLEDHLKKRNYFNGYECKQITCQLTSALAYLHELDPLIVHRDIKIQNILVFSRQDSKLAVKFADFGLAKEGDYLKTFCGTLQTLPPELSDIPWVGYTPAVDMWSLGVVITQLLCGLPKWKDEEYTQDYTLWCAAIRHRLENWCKGTHDNLAKFLLDTMVIIDADARWTAMDCYPRAVHLPDGPRATWKVLIPAVTIPPTVEGDSSGDNNDDDDEDQSEQTIIRAGMEGEKDEEEEARAVTARNTVGLTADIGMYPLSSLDSASLTGYLTGLSDLHGDAKYVRSDAQDPNNLAPTVQKVPVDEYLDKFSNPHGSLFLMSSFGQSTMFGNSSRSASGSCPDPASSVQGHQGEISLASDRQTTEVAVAPQDDITDEEWSGEEVRLHTSLIADGLSSGPPVYDDEWVASMHKSRTTQNKRKRSRPNYNILFTSPNHSSRLGVAGTSTHHHKMKRRNTEEKSE